MELGATTALVARVTLAAAFALSAASKLGNRTAFARGLAEFGVPGSRVVAGTLPVVEGGLAVALVVVRDAAWPAFLAIAVLAAFTVAVIASLLSGAPKPCPCFGPPGADAAPVSAATVARNGCLVAVAVLGTGSTAGASPAGTAAGAAIAVTVTLAFLRRFG